MSTNALSTPEKQRSPSGTAAAGRTVEPSTSSSPVKPEPPYESGESSGEGEDHDQYPDQELEQENETGFAQDTPAEQPRPKRKGGRKPIYATSEERKQRNRQAQAAFRERRTEYIKQLETNIQRLEAQLSALQQSHRAAGEECLMLRYKNSLLERILLEKGIDVSAELQRKTGSPALGPTVMPPLPIQPTPTAPLQRAMMNRHNQQVRRSLSSLPKVEPAPGQVRHGSHGSYDSLHHSSPMLHPTPASHVSTPNSVSPAFGPQGMTPPKSDMAQSVSGLPAHAHPIQMQTPSMAATSPSVVQFGMQPMASPSVLNGAPSTAGSSTSFYPSPFQNHMDQLEQEYEAQADMEEDQSDHSNGEAFQQQQQAFMQPVAPPGMVPVPVTNGQFMPEAYQQFEPMMDTDPFGLSQSMQIPTTFSYEGALR